MSDSFTTAIEGASGSWPEPPDMWSFSSFKEAEECPRRWMLRRATYPDIWDGRGYPDQATIPAMLGDVVHGVLERILVALHEEGCEGLSDVCAVKVLKALGGYSRLIESTIHERLEQYERNPRVVGRLPYLRATLRSRTPEIRQRVQGLVSRTNMTSPGLQQHRAGGGTGLSRGHLGVGSYPEVELVASELRWAGRADLLTVMDHGCEITDYKTGVPQEHHAKQLQTYAWLWMRDRVVNRAGLPVRRLLLGYPTHDEAVEVPDAAALNAFEAELLARSRKVEDDLRIRPPEAKPALDICSVCSVRHMCDRYWPFLSAIEVARSPGSEEMLFVDAEVVVVARNGSRSWNVTIRHPASLVRQRSFGRRQSGSASGAATG